MTTVGLSFKGMKDTVFLPSNESSGLVKALLELDDSPTGSDEEFLDFQFKIADAKAREREASEQLSDWRAAFANLQVWIPAATCTSAVKIRPSTPPFAPNYYAVLRPCSRSPPLHVHFCLARYSMCVTA